MNRSDWLGSLKIGDRVYMTRPRKETRVMIVRMIDARHVFMTDARDPKGDLARGEMVWLEGGEGPYGEKIYPLDRKVLAAIGGSIAPDLQVGGWEAAR
jgi:hypothetical protein